MTRTRSAIDGWPRSSRRSRALTGVLAEDGTPLYLSPAALALHVGLASQDVRDVTVEVDRIHPDDFEMLASNFGVALEHPEKPIPVRYRVRHVDGSWRTLEGTYTNLLGDPEVAGVVMDVSDVTERGRGRVGTARERGAPPSRASTRSRRASSSRPRAVASSRAIPRPR